MANKEKFFESAIEGKPSHRLCMDFNHPDGIRDFMARAKAEGMLPSESEPLCIFAEGGSSVWLVGQRKKPSIIEVN